MLNIFKKQEKAKEVKGDTTVDRLVTLIVMDGFGIHPDHQGNAVLGAKTPFLDAAWSNGRSTLINASGTYVGLPNEVPGNSEVGHLNIGAGQVVYQSLPRINDAIERHEFQKAEVIESMFKHVKKNNSRLHLTGVLSAAGVHGHIKHLFSILELCKEMGVSPYLHLIMDGRDTAPNEGYWYLSKLQRKLKDLGIGKIASMSGRFYAMDRDGRWERTKLAYDAMIGISPDKFVDPIKAVQDAYAHDLTDEFIVPSIAVDEKGKPIAKVEENDAIFFWNFREDRARQLTKSFVLQEWSHFPRAETFHNLYFLTMTGYEEGLPAKVVFPPMKVKMSMAEYISSIGAKQFHVAESEKYMHVTYFFNGGIEKANPGEDFFYTPSPRVNDYAQTPAMAAMEVKTETVRRIKSNDKFGYSFVLVNFANPDMIGHTGDYNAAVKANEITDECVAEISKATLDRGGAVVITADHGNCETMINRMTKEVDIAHTNNPIPFIILDDSKQVIGVDSRNTIRIGTGDKSKATGILADVSPTVLSLMGVDIPGNMTGMDLSRAV